MKIKIVLGSILAAIGIFLFGIVIIGGEGMSQFLIPAIIIILIAATLLVLGFRDTSDNHDDNEDTEHYCHLHRRNLATERCNICRQWTCEVGAHRNEDGTLTCPLCQDKKNKRAFAENNHIPYKSKTTAILLAIFLGALGIHRFYLGRKNGLLYLGLFIIFCWTVFVPIILEFCALIDLIMIASGNWTDQYYRNLI